MSEDCFTMNGQVFCTGGKSVWVQVAQTAQWPIAFIFMAIVLFIYGIYRERQITARFKMMEEEKETTTNA